MRITTDEDNGPIDPVEEERRCDLCKYEKDLPCIGKDCHSPDLKGFKPKGSEKEYTGCKNCLCWSIVRIGKFCPDCGRKL